MTTHSFPESWPSSVPADLLQLAEEVERDIQEKLRRVDQIARKNFYRVIRSFHQEGIKEFHLHGTAGYGLFDAGREALDRVWARAFAAEKALVRLQLVSGTHAMACAVLGNLKPGDQLLVPDEPYETLQKVFLSLPPQGITVTRYDADRVRESLPVSRETTMIFLQRSRGYRWSADSSGRPLSLSVQDLRHLIGDVREKNPEAVIVVDNCYGEFVEEEEPLEAGADLIAGSLIKNPGGGIAPTGGYVAGKAELVTKASERLTAPGIGSEIGATLDCPRSFFQGLFLSPFLVGEALKGGIFASLFFQRLGFEVSPGWDDHRTDLILAVKLGAREKLLAFSRGIQMAGAVDSQVTPVPSSIAGYDDEIVMAGGTFIQGASLELSCDAPLRPPFVASLQGGLFFPHTILGCLYAASQLRKV